MYDQLEESTFELNRKESNKSIVYVWLVARINIRIKSERVKQADRMGTISCESQHSN